MQRQARIDPVCGTGCTVGSGGSFTVTKPVGGQGPFAMISSLGVGATTGHASPHTVL